MNYCVNIISHGIYIGTHKGYHKRPLVLLESNYLIGLSVVVDKIWTHLYFDAYHYGYSSYTDDANEFDYVFKKKIGDYGIKTDPLVSY